MRGPVEDSREPVADLRHRGDRRAAGVVVAGHTLLHVLLQGFFVIVPEIYRSLGLTPVSAGLLETVRRGVGGVASMGGGFVLDRVPHRRLLVLQLSVIVMGTAYLAAGLVPSYAVLLGAMALTGAAFSIWHPAAIGLLSQTFPRRRGLMISVHRSSGNLGDAVGPLMVGGLLVVAGWQTILVGALPLALVAGAMLWVMLLSAPSWRARLDPSTQPRSIGEQFRDLRQVVRSRSLLMLLVIAGFTGLGQGGAVLWLGLYLSETQGMGSVGIGVHVALLTGFGMVASPLIGALSDRVGRRPVIVAVVASNAVFAACMALAGSGLLFSASTALLGAVMFGVNPLIQAAALDLAHGRQLEGSMLGVLFGFNAVFAGLSPLLIGSLVAALGYGTVFWYVAAVNACATVPGLLLVSGAPLLGDLGAD